MTTNAPKHKHFYAAHSYMGLEFTYDSPCWIVYIFDDPADRDAWVNDNEYSQDSGHYVAQAIFAKTAFKIAPDLRKAWLDPHDPNNMPARINHL